MLFNFQNLLKVYLLFISEPKIMTCVILMPPNRAPMKKFIAPTLLLVSPACYACTTCNKTLQEAIFDSTFYPNLFVMLSAFIVLAIIVSALVAITKASEKKRAIYLQSRLTTTPLFAASTVLGIGIGGIIDGTVLHQILQWHEMLSNKLPPVTLLNKSVNMFWDGVFHAYCLVVVVIGIWLLYKLFYRRDVIINGSIFIGGHLFGWGLFNLVEGIIDHQLLKLHNVREVSLNIAYWNYGFLAFSIVLIIAGALLYRVGSRDKHYVNILKVTYKLIKPCSGFISL
jgi:uncharacterized membrane protein